MNSTIDSTSIFPVPTSATTALKGNNDDNSVKKTNQKSDAITTLGFSILLLSAPISTGIDISPGALGNSSSIISYKNAIADMFDISVLREFVSNLLTNSHDLDKDIVDMVNENFWDLI